MKVNGSVSSIFFRRAGELDLDALAGSLAPAAIVFIEGRFFPVLELVPLIERILKPGLPIIPASHGEFGPDFFHPARVGERGVDGVKSVIERGRFENPLDRVGPDLVRHVEEEDIIGITEAEPVAGQI